MKYIALLFAALIGLSVCHVRFFKTAEHFIEDVGSKEDDIGDFFEGLFSHFNLSSPAQIKECFNNINGGLYFSHLQEINKILEDTSERSSVQLHLELVKFAFIEKSLEGTHACIAMTQDFTDLLNALGINGRDPMMFNLYLYLYYQAHYIDLYEGFKPIIDNLNTQSNKAAGDAFGAVLVNLVNTTKTEGSAFLAFAGFGNGAAISLNIDEPDDSLQCFDNTSAHLFLHFTYRLTVAVSEGSINEAPLNVYKFWNNEGKDILGQIPQSVFDCQAKSNDVQKVSQKLGVDVASEEFGQSMIKYVNDYRLSYYVMCRSMKGALENHNFHHAGSIHAHFLKAVASITK